MPIANKRSLTLTSPDTFEHFHEWASQVVIDLSDYNVPLPYLMRDWREWADAVSQDQRIPLVPNASKIAYNCDVLGWKQWGLDWVQSFGTEGGQK